MTSQFDPKLAIVDITRGDKSAAELLTAFYLWTHSQDDLIDRDHAPDVANAVGFNLQMLRAFGKNEFFQKHQDFLWPVILTSALAYINSEERKKSPDVLERITAQVLKSEYVNVFFAVALVVDGGGFDHALAMTRKYRIYSFDDELAAEKSAF
jgi:hypothetical protein